MLDDEREIFLGLNNYNNNFGNERNEVHKKCTEPLENVNGLQPAVNLTTHAFFSGKLM